MDRIRGWLDTANSVAVLTGAGISAESGIPTFRGPGGRWTQCHCGGLERPGVVWFGEALPPDVWIRAEEGARKADVFLVIGTSAVVYPAASLVGLAKSSGAKVVEVNIAETPVSSMVDASLRGSAAEILPGLIS